MEGWKTTLERWRSSRLANLAARLIGLCLIIDAAVLADGTITAQPTEKSNAVSYTQLFSHDYSSGNTIKRDYEFINGEAMNILGIAALAGSGIYLLRRRVEE